MKRLPLFLCIALLSACKSADDYVGIWSQDDLPYLAFAEISKSGGDYILTTNGRNPQKLAEKNGKLILTTVAGDRTIKLSDDGKTLYAGLYSMSQNGMHKVEDEQCKQLARQSYTLRLNNNNVDTVAAAQKQYFSQCRGK